MSTGVLQDKALQNIIVDTYRFPQSLDSEETQVLKTCIRLIQDFNHKTGNHLSIKICDDELIIGNSDSISRDKLFSIIQSEDYVGLEPEVKPHRDQQGNLIISLTLKSFLLDHDNFDCALESIPKHSYIAGTPNYIAGQLARLGVQLTNKKVLDVGTKTGENLVALKNSGASEIWAVEPDDKNLQQAVGNRYVDPDKGLPIKLQDLPTSLHQSFDVVTVFLYNVLYAEQPAFFRTLCSSINPQGYVIIGAADQAYISDSTSKLDHILKENFHSIRRKDFVECDNKTIWVCKEPKAAEKLISTASHFFPIHTQIAST